LFEPVKKEKFDSIAFNPPYLPTGKEDETRAEEDAAWNGGRDGRKWIEPFLKEFPAHLKPRGFLLMLHSSLANTNKTIKKLAEMNFTVEKILEQRFFFEELVVLKVSRRK
jgi:release factor glutamine methyltransferase